ncbi:MAG: RimK family protein [Rhodospirillaceae bacterium]|nr:RimK family protein [Rhodospirillaceae bacterium]
MSGWTVVIDRIGDLWGGRIPATVQVISTREYITNPRSSPGSETKVINLSRTYSYLGAGYYASLLAEARGQRVLPTVDTILELRQRSLYRHGIPDLEDELNRRAKRWTDRPTQPVTLLVCLGQCEDVRFRDLARLVFNRFRAPILSVRVMPGDWLQIASIRHVAVSDMDADGQAFFLSALAQFAHGTWRQPRARQQPRHTIAVLHDPKQALPPTSVASLRRLARVAERMGVLVEPIVKKDLARLAEYDALLIRETTTIEDHTYRFAKRAEQEGMPVIDDPTSILRCTNKVYLFELLEAAGVPTPRTKVVDGLRHIDDLANGFGYPIVLKIPDGSFSRGVKKAEDPKQLRRVARELLEDSDLILAQEYVYTPFDWRVGVLDGEPLFVCQYQMARKHWQILKHSEDGRFDEGRFRTFAIEDAPEAVVATALAAARLIGSGLYGVDLKETERGVVVMEINDNPNLEHGVEDAVAKDELWRRLIAWFQRRLEG